MASRKMSISFSLTEIVLAEFKDSADFSIKTDGPNYVEFKYKGMTIRTIISIDRILGRIFEVEISDGMSEYMSLATLIAYFDNQKYNLYCSKDNALQNIRLAKKYIDEGNLIFVYCDTNKQERQISINGNIKKLPFLVCNDYKKEAEILYEEKAKRIIDNLPICEGPARN